jgi:hypothetical protein
MGCSCRSTPAARRGGPSRPAPRRRGTNWKRFGVHRQASPQRSRWADEIRSVHGGNDMRRRPEQRNVCPLSDLSPRVWLRQPLSLVMARGGGFFCVSSLPSSVWAFRFSLSWPPGTLGGVRTLNFPRGLFRCKISLLRLIGDRLKCRRQQKLPKILRQAKKR